MYFSSCLGGRCASVKASRTDANFALEMVVTDWALTLSGASQVDGIAMGLCTVRR